MGGANTMLPIEGVVLKGVDVGDVWPSCKLKSIGIAIHTVWTKLNKLVGGVRIAV